jgi:hypothetical protein
MKPKDTVNQSNRIPKEKTPGGPLDIDIYMMSL